LRSGEADLVFKQNDHSTQPDRRSLPAGPESATDGESQYESGGSDASDGHDIQQVAQETVHKIEHEPPHDNVPAFAPVESTPPASADQAGERSAASGSTDSNAPEIPADQAARRA
jgi:hypothetical protein